MTIAPDGTMDVTPAEQYVGSWRADINYPPLVNGQGIVGQFYICVAPGTALGQTFADNDRVAYARNETWQRLPPGALSGTASISGGSVTGLSLFGVGAGYTSKPINPLLPIYADVQLGSDGVSMFGYTDPTGLFYRQRMTADVGTIASLDVGIATVDTLDTAGLIVRAGNPLSGVQVAFLDSTGTKAWLTYDYDGNVGVKSLKVDGTLIEASAASSGVPSYAVDVTQPQFGAKGYMRRGHFYATYTAGQLTISIAKFVGAVTATVGSDAFAIVGANGLGIAFMPGFDDGDPIWIQGAGPGGADLVTTIAQVIDGENVVLGGTISTVPTGGSVGVVWPCFTASDLNTILWVDCGSQPVYSLNFTPAVTTAQVGAVSGGSTIVISSAAGVSVNQTVVDNTNTAAIPGSVFPGVGVGTQVSAISGTTITLSGAVTSSNGDSLSFGQVGVQQTDTTCPYGVQPMMTIITDIVGPTSVSTTLSGKAVITTFPTSSAGLPTEMAWGIDDSVAWGAASDFAPTVGSKIVYAPGPGRGYMTSSLFNAGGFYRTWIAANTDQAADYYVVWAGDNQAGGHHVDVGGRKLWLKQVPIFSGGVPQNMRTANLRKQMPGLAGKSSLLVMTIGASLAQTNPQTQDAPLWFDNDMFVEKMISDNPGVALTFVNYGVGGTSLAELDNGLVSPGAAAYFWYTNTGASIFSYALGQSPAPDIIYIAAAGANDGWGFHPLHWRSVVNRLRAQFPSAYILWQIIGCKGQQGYNLPGVQPEIDTYPNGYVRGACTQLNIPFVDPDPIATRVHYGWDPLRLRERFAPSFSGPVAAGAPWNVRMLVRDPSGVFTLGSAQTGASAWAALGKLRFRTSPRDDSFFDLDIDATNHLRYAVQDWGATVTTPCAMNNGSHALTTSGQTSYTGNIRWRTQHRDIEVGSPSGPFISGDVGKCFLFPNADANGAAMRSFIQRVPASYSAFSYDCNTVNVNVSAAPGVLIYGGMMFKPEDATGHADCVIGPDGSGNILVTKVATYVGPTQITTVDAWPYASLSPGSPVPVFVGYRSVPPTSTTLLAGSDSGTGARVDFSLKGRRLICRYWLGGTTWNVPPIIFDGIIPRCGGEFPWTVSCTGSGTTLAGNNLWRDEEDYSWRPNTFYELSGSLDEHTDGRYGGAGVHPSSVSAELITRPTLEANDLAT
jgi:hypothetical protein